ncbi:hypothetical protein [Paludibacter sp. 221]|uniref:hypothetical protein n=1 Tax=Paludibacter sp. 221 TaxID=2302939 RepID=UPI0013D21DEB|nr:hypothetical protein [Paludibacter sp. 221]
MSKKRSKGTEIFELFRSYCRHNGIPFQAVRSRSVSCLSNRFWLSFDKEKEVTIFDVRFSEYRTYLVPELSDLFAVLCDAYYKIFDVEHFLSFTNAVARPLHYYEVQSIQFGNCSALGPSSATATFPCNIVYNSVNTK